MGLAKSVVLIGSLLVSAILFGFFFTLSFTIMPGLDQTDPYSAIAANQEIGRATKQSYFFIALLGTPLLIIASLLLSISAKYRAGILWLLFALASFAGMMFVTFTLNVPLNEQLDGLATVPDQGNLADLWSQYSVDWQRWNLWRFVLSGVTVMAIGLALSAHAASNKK